MLLGLPDLAQKKGVAKAAQAAFQGAVQADPSRVQSFGAPQLPLLAPDTLTSLGVFSEGVTDCISCASGNGVSFHPGSLFFHLAGSGGGGHSVCIFPG